MKNDWTEKVRDKLSESTATPPDSLWTGITSQLDTAMSTQSRHQHIRIWRWVAAACLLAVVTYGVHILISERADNDVAVENLAYKGNETIPADLNTSVLYDDKPTTINASTRHTFVKSQSHGYCTSNLILSQIDEVEQSDKVSQDKLAISVQSSESNTANETADSLHTIATSEYLANTTTTTTTVDHIQQPTDYSPFNNYGHKSRNIFSVSLYASNTNMPNLSSGLSGINTGDIVGSDPFYDPMGGTSSGTQNPEPMRYELKDVKHSQPIRFGASVRLPLSSVLSIGSGVVYSRLTSTFTWGNSKTTSFESKQTLNYIGVPVSIDYNLPSYKSAGFYITGGVILEKCIYGETHLVYSPVTERVSEKAVQTSLFLGVGAEIKLNRHFSIYAEPLATFYIDNNSDIKNIYKDRPLNFDLRIGVRYNLR